MQQSLSSPAHHFLVFSHRLFLTFVVFSILLSIYHYGVPEFDLISFLAMPIVRRSIFRGTVLFLILLSSALPVALHERTKMRERM